MIKFNEMWLYYNFNIVYLILRDFQKLVKVVFKLLLFLNSGFQITL